MPEYIKNKDKKTHVDSISAKYAVIKDKSYGFQTKLLDYYNFVFDITEKLVARMRNDISLLSLLCYKCSRPCLGECQLTKKY